MELVKELDKQGNFLFKYRGILPLIILVVGLAVYAYVIWEGASTYRLTFQNNEYEFFCLAVALLGLVIRILTVGFTPRHTSGRNTQQQVADTLNTSGMYSTVRHPLYVGNFFMWLGVALLTQHAWFTIAFVLLYWMYYERIMFTEEKFIAGKFGEKFYAWAAQTPAIIPNPARWRNPDLQFNPKKVLRQEKNGFFAVFLLFFVFDTVGEFITYGDVSFRNFHWLVLCIASGVLYLVLKLLKNKTQVLAD
ncbi:isoprenylcysteine carboxylmethyltransferase family protein [Telluribacter sp.]|jgi:protein-S-isoprenylcysteine O-methyltransferase Ste14|uniref:methyltransferase family protein n=1 Tax=Telluribacter sp. TaxID=1978767 RepID=UPI002E15B891|nr:isoprenylcysteine carboxylmethyltransferase family protein [Telluribacter sp.]